MYFNISQDILQIVTLYFVKNDDMLEIHILKIYMYVF